jgi:hypothetical protein
MIKNIMDGIGAKIAGAFGIVSSTQLYQYMIQYTQRLGGHIDQIRSHLENITAGNGTPDPGLVEKLNELQSSLDRINSAGYLTKFYTFLSNTDPGIAEGTWENFAPGLPVSLDSAVYLALGVAASSLIYKGLKELAIFSFKKEKYGGNQNE